VEGKFNLNKCSNDKDVYAIGVICFMFFNKDIVSPKLLETTEKMFETVERSTHEDLWAKSEVNLILQRDMKM
jgi:hypothetical protein